MQEWAHSNFHYSLMVKICPFQGRVLGSIPSSGNLFIYIYLFKYFFHLNKYVKQKICTLYFFVFLRIETGHDKALMFRMHQNAHSLPLFPSKIIWLNTLLCCVSS